MYKAASALFVASIGRYAGQLAIFVVIARTLGSNAAGNYSLALAISAPIFVFLGLGIRTLYLTRHIEVPLAIYERLRIATALTGVGVATVVATIFGPDVITVALSVAALKAIDSFADLYMVALQKSGRLKPIVAYSFTNTSIQIAAVIVGTTLMRTELTAALALAAVMSLVLLSGFLRPLSRRVAATAHSLKIDMAGFKLLLRSGVALGGADSVMSLSLSIPQLYLGFLSTPTNIAIYAALSYIPTAIEMMLNPLAQSWIPAARAQYANGKLKLGTSIRQGTHWLAITFPVSVMGILVAPVLFPVVFGSNFKISLAEGALLALSTLVLPFVFAITTLIAVLNRYRVLAKVNLGTLIIVALAGIPLVSWFDLTGAVLLFAVGALSRLGMSLFAVSSIGGLLAKQRRNW